MPELGPESLKVGQLWKCIEDKKQTVMISLVLLNELQGHLFDGFQVAKFVSFDLKNFCRYWYLFHDPRS